MDVQVPKLERYLLKSAGGLAQELKPRFHLANHSSKRPLDLLIKVLCIRLFLLTSMSQNILYHVAVASSELHDLQISGSHITSALRHP